MDFQVGDIVEFGGLEGKVTYLANGVPYPLRVVYSSGDCDEFTIDGRYHVKQTKPILNLVRRAKKKVTKTIECWVNVYPDGTPGYSYETKELADTAKMRGRIACVKLTGTYELDE